MNKEKTLVISVTCNAFIDDDDEHNENGKIVYPQMNFK